MASRSNSIYKNAEKSLLDKAREEDPVNYDPKMRCGVFSFRPDWLQHFNNMKFFTAIISCYSLFGTVCFSYYSSVVYQIEKAYGLSSSTTGFLKNVDNIGYMMTVICVGHFCRYVNKPRLFFVAAFFSSASILLFAMPHFVYPPTTSLDEYISDQKANTSNHYNRADDKYLCQGRDGSQEDEFCDSMNNMKNANIGALAIFVASELSQGMFNSPKYSLSLTYIDDNAKDSSPMYFSFMFATRALAPALGFTLGAWTSGMYVDFSDPGFDSKDPRWIGCWWLGFVICAACSVVWAFPISCFPAVLKDRSTKPTQMEVKRRLSLKPVEDNNNADDAALPEAGDEDPDVGMAEQVKDLPSAMLRIMKNPIFVMLIVSVCIEIQMMGFTTFTPKYLQFYFGLTPSMASIMTGILVTLSFAVGPIVAGQVMARNKVTPAWALRFMVIVSCLSWICFLVSTFLSCGEEPWHTDISDSESLTVGCNGNCSCSPELFLPVCDEGGVNYYSPCHAGCTQPPDVVDNVETFSNCSCVESGIVTKGKCERKCSIFILYLVFITVAKFLGAMDFVPRTMCVIRLMDSRDKALAISTFGAIAMTAGFPAPFFFGMVIDSTCVVFQSVCGDKGACLQYDTEQFRTSIHTFGLVIKGVSILVQAACWYIAWRQENRMNKIIQQNLAKRESLTKEQLAQQVPLMEIQEAGEDSRLTSADKKGDVTC